MANTLITPFLTDDPMFAAGCEFGMLYSEMKERPQELSTYIARENQDRVCVMANRCGYHIEEMEPWDGYWLYLKMKLAGEE